MPIYQARTALIGTLPAAALRPAPTLSGLIDAFSSQLKGVMKESFLNIMQINNNSFIIHLGKESDVDFYIAHGLKFRGSPIKLEKAKSTTTVTVDRFPFGLSRDILTQSLGVYGEVTSCEPVLYKGYGVSRYTVEINLRSDIPSRLRVRGNPINIFYRGQPRSCFSCGQVGHEAKLCPRRRAVPRRAADAALNDDRPAIDRLGSAGPASTISRAPTSAPVVTTYASAVTGQVTLTTTSVSLPGSSAGPSRPSHSKERPTPDSDDDGSVASPPAISSVKESDPPSSVDLDEGESDGESPSKRSKTELAADITEDADSDSVSPEMECEASTVVQRLSAPSHASDGAVVDLPLTKDEVLNSVEDVSEIPETQFDDNVDDNSLEQSIINPKVAVTASLVSSNPPPSIDPTDLPLPEDDFSDTLGEISEFTPTQENIVPKVDVVPPDLSGAFVSPVEGTYSTFSLVMSPEMFKEPPPFIGSEGIEGLGEVDSPLLFSATPSVRKSPHSVSESSDADTASNLSRRVTTKKRSRSAPRGASPPAPFLRKRTRPSLVTQRGKRAVQEESGPQSLPDM